MPVLPVASPGPWEPTVLCLVLARARRPLLDLHVGQQSVGVLRGPGFRSLVFSSLPLAAALRRGFENLEFLP